MFYCVWKSDVLTPMVQGYAKITNILIAYCNNMKFKSHLFNKKAVLPFEQMKLHIVTFYLFCGIDDSNCMMYTQWW